jgi:hypothetical protein
VVLDQVFDGASSAALWADAFGDGIVESAFGGGATDWAWHRHTWGTVLEVEFADEADWERFQTLPAVVAALDNVPDPVSGLLIYKGRGGSAGRPVPRRPRPLIGSGAAALPLPFEPDDLFSSWPAADLQLIMPKTGVGARIR